MKNINNNYNKWIVFISVLIPIVVASLFRIKLDLQLPVFLPPIYASINALTAIILIIAVFAVKRGNRKLHELLMKIAIGLSVLFLSLYVLYHMTSTSTSFRGEGVIRYVYFTLLISHIALSIVVIPFVLITFVKAITNNIKQHKKIAAFTFPIWLYVTVSGVLVYLLISPYYLQ